jgi:hypothetical protein
MNAKQLERTCQFYERIGFIGQDLSDLMQDDVAKCYEEEQNALIYFGAIDAEQEEVDNKDQFRPISSGEWQEDVVLIGEEISDYEATMEAFLEECYQDSL